mmetsp:Transcript_45977/g.67848  ORF Transcript_45977/g.67848 Transcript_45977/m.67848 type:complete len:192 (-) Transcript_45977:163-738(-)
MCGEKTNASPQLIATAAADWRSIAPDIITLTDVLATLERSSKSSKYRERTDKVFSEAVRRGIILNAADSLDSFWEVDFSGMSFPVARAACRFIFNRALESVKKGDEKVQELTLITGLGVAQRQASNSNLNTNDDEGAHATIGLQEFVRANLRDDLEPPVYSMIPPYGKGTVVVKHDMIQKWIDSQPQPQIR